jgi:hypothetical protein
MWEAKMGERAMWEAVLASLVGHTPNQIKSRWNSCS